jgi:hypothetical protein
MSPIIRFPTFPHSIIPKKHVDNTYKINYFIRIINTTWDFFDWFVGTSALRPFHSVLSHLSFILDPLSLFLACAISYDPPFIGI